MRNVLFSTALVLVSLFAHAEPGVWGSRGISQRFVASGSLLFAADGRGVTIYDVSNGTSPRRLSVTRSDDETTDIAVAGSVAVTATAHGIEIFSVQPDNTLFRTATIAENGGASRVAASATRVAAAIPGSLVVRNTAGDLIRRIPESRAINALAFHGDRLFAGIEGGGLAVYDADGGGVTANLAINAQGLAFSGSTLYVAGGAQGLYVLDVANPDAPRIVGQTGAGEVDMRGVAVDGTRAFAWQPPSTIYAFDVSSAASLRIVATMTDYAQALAMSNGRLYVSGTIVDAFANETATGVPLRVYDAATRAVSGEVRDFAGPLSGVATDGTFAYVVDPPFFRVLDVSNPSQTREVASLNVAGLQDRIRIRRGLAVVYGRGDVNLLDIHNPFAPKLLGTYRSNGHPPSNADLARDTLIEANNYSGLHVVDYSNPANMVQIAGRIMHYVDVLTGDDVVYAFHADNMVVLDLSVRTQVVERASTFLPTQQAEKTDQLLLVRTPEGLHVFTLGDIYDPQEIAIVPMTGLGQFGVAGDKLYVATGESLTLVDLDNPSEPVLSPTDLRVTAPMQVAVATNGKILVADRYGLRIYGPVTAAPAPPKRRSAGH